VKSWCGAFFAAGFVVGNTWTSTGRWVTTGTFSIESFEVTRFSRLLFNHY